MPKYTYKCKECENIFDISHCMSERLTDCEKCNTINTLVKVPHNIATQYKNKQTGKVVETHIEEARQEVEEEKKRLQQQEWDN